MFRLGIKEDLCCLKDWRQIFGSRPGGLEICQLAKIHMAQISEKDKLYKRGETHSPLQLIH